VRAFLCGAGSRVIAVVTKREKFEEFGGCSLRTVASNRLPFIPFLF
jgi:hypothetical protein